MVHRELLIDGHFVGGPCDHSIGKLAIRAPWDGTIVGTAAEGAWEEANVALQAAVDAFGAWQSTPGKERATFLKRVSDAIRARRDELAELLCDEVGKPITWARSEVDRTSITFELASLEAPQSGWDSIKEIDLCLDPRATSYSATWARAPIGPILAIVPYNWPLNLAAHKVAPALAAGNTVVVKPSSQAPLSTLTLCRILHECGSPPGVVNAVVCSASVAERMAVDPRVRKVSFTGSPAVGWHLKELLPRKRVTLELGGDAFAVVMPDADLDRATERIVAGAFGYAGQVCISVQHVLAHEAIYAELRERLTRATQACPAGDPRDPATVCGPLISDQAADAVQRVISQAQATLLAGGRRERRLVYPTLLEDVPLDSDLATREVFGPVATLAAFATVDQAIERVNASRYGIQVGVFTRDEGVGDRFWREAQVGGVVLDDIPTVRFDAMPYGGVKESGFGREGVRFAIEEMTEPKALLRHQNPH